ncbi:MAG TPA: hypothetical protein VMH81_16340 [Bryobacteraceae bacterium]|nr:hypothetical protein [Bryobacteraceae bacterium]
MAIPSLKNYRVVWRRIGDWDTFEHHLSAPDCDQAQAESSRHVQQALGTNARLWRIVEVAESGSAELILPIHFPTVL